MSDIYPLIAGIAGVVVMSFFLRRARFLHLPETEMIRAIGSAITKRVDNALLPGTIIHTAGGVLFAYVYSFLLSTAPDAAGSMMVIVVACTLMGLVHGLVVTLFLVITVAQYHPIDEFKKLEPGDMAAHVISHIAYGLTVGICLGVLPNYI
ncbi:MAG: hypothetical protein KDC35_03480 [Acidobacteria bacterium]|nr:hypothetical protein [Acidobacteriota bacterium]